MQQHIIEKRTQNKWDCNEHITVSKSFTLHFKNKKELQNECHITSFETVHPKCFLK